MVSSSESSSLGRPWAPLRLDGTDEGDEAESDQAGKAHALSACWQSSLVSPTLSACWQSPAARVGSKLTLEAPDCCAPQSQRRLQQRLRLRLPT